MRTLLTLMFALMGTSVGAPAALAQTVAYSISSADTHVHWEVRHFGTSTHRGRFDNVSASIDLDRVHQRGNVSVTIATAVVDSGVGALDCMLRSGTFLASAAHPKAYFVSSNVLFDADRLKEARGEFTLRGISRPLTLRALQFSCRADPATTREICGGDFEAEFLRSDYGITFGLPFVGDKVRLVIQVEAVRE